MTDRRQAEAPWARLSISIMRLEVTSDGVAPVAADWVMTHRDPDLPLLRDRRAFSSAGPATTDGDVVALDAAVIVKLADAIASDQRVF